MRTIEETLGRLRERLLGMRPVRMAVETIQRTTAVRVPRMAAALVFYLMLSLAPLLVVVVGVAGLVVGQRAEQIYDQMLASLSAVVGSQPAKFIADAVAAQTRRVAEGVVATGVGVFVLLWGASRGFNEFQDALNTIWSVEPPDGIRPGLVRTLRQRTLSFVLALSGGVVLTLYVLVRPAVNTFGKALSAYVPGAIDVANALNAVLAYVLITAVVATLYRLLPETSIWWSDVWLASLLVALVLTVGQVVFTAYLGVALELGFLGAATSPLVVLALAHTAVQTVYVGATFSRVYSEHLGSRAKQTSHEETDSMGIA